MMARQEVEDAVRYALREQSGGGIAMPDLGDKISTYSTDSLDHTEMLMLIEDSLGCCTNLEIELHEDDTFDTLVTKILEFIEEDLRE